MIEVSSAENEFHFPEQIKARLNELLVSMKEALATADRATTLFREMNDEVKEAQQELQNILIELEASGHATETSPVYQDQLEILTALIESRADMQKIFDEEIARADALEATFEELQVRLQTVSRRPRPQA